ncbi:MAG: dephospho-CoA kinase [Spirochaetes bacterium]|nr:dephospho-CoA kinase [Spirochaetota bacterium]
MIIGLTGKYCSGKSSIAEVFEEKGFYVIEVDKLGHAALKIKMNEIEKTFGSIVIKNAEVDRYALGKIIFKSSRKKEMLEKIVHPVMVQEVENILKQRQGENILIDAAILAHMRLHKYCDAVIWIKAPFFKRLFMAMHRDNRGIFFALRRMISQRKLKSNLTKKYVDTYIVHNSGDINSLPDKVDNILKTINSRK